MPVPIHPGEHLAEKLRARNMSASALARQIGVPTNRVTRILNGQRSVSADTALRLAGFFGTSAVFWLNLQSLYELRVAEAEDDGGHEARAASYNRRPCPSRIAARSSRPSPPRDC